MRVRLIKIMMCVFFGVCFHPLFCPASPYHIDEPVRVFSQYVAGPNISGENAIQYSVTPKYKTDGSVELSFYQEASDRPEPPDQPVCRISLSDSGNPVAWTGGAADGDTIHSDHLLILPGFPAPCDILPVAKLMGKAGPLIYDVRREAGGRGFVERIQVTSTAVDMDEAVLKGWVTKDGHPASTGLFLIRAINLRTNALMVQQLWPADGSWWIYEETPFRRSWMVRE